MAGLLWLSCVTCLLSAIVQTSGASHDPYPAFSPTELHALLDATNRVLSEKGFLAERIDMLEMQKRELFEKLDEVEGLVEIIDNSSSTQDDNLQEINEQIKDLLHGLGDKKASGARQARLAQCTVDLMSSTDAAVDRLKESNNQQSADIQELKHLMDENKEKLSNSLFNKIGTRSTAIAIVLRLANQFIELINKKKCEQFQLSLNTSSGIGEMTIDLPPLLFDGQVPDVSCSVCDLVSHLLIDAPSSFSYAFGFVDEREATGLTVDCKALSPEAIRVLVFDQSRGGGNYITEVGVTLTACTYSPLGH